MSTDSIEFSFICFSGKYEQTLPLAAKFLILTKEISKRREYLIADKTKRLKAEGLKLFSQKAPF